MGENIQPSGATPAATIPVQSSTTAAIYSQMFPTNNSTLTNDPHHQYGAFGSGFSAAAVACSSNGYPPFFSSKLKERLGFFFITDCSSI